MKFRSNAIQAIVMILLAIPLSSDLLAQKEQAPFYYYQNKKITLVENSDKILLKLSLETYNLKK